MAIAMTLKQYLEDRDADFELIRHARTASSAETAQEAHIPGDQLAKAVLLKADSKYLLAVCPSTHHLDMAALKQSIKSSVEMAEEDEVDLLFSDCVRGAIPPMGDAYGLDVIMDDSLDAAGDIYFEAGDHQNLVHMAGNTFKELMGGKKRMHISNHD